MQRRPRCRLQQGRSVLEVVYSQLVLLSVHPGLCKLPMPLRHMVILLVTAAVVVRRLLWLLELALLRAAARLLRPMRHIARCMLVRMTFNIVKLKFEVVPAAVGVPGEDHADTRPILEVEKHLRLLALDRNGRRVDHGVPVINFVSLLAAVRHVPRRHGNGLLVRCFALLILSYLNESVHSHVIVEAASYRQGPRMQVTMLVSVFQKCNVVSALALLRRFEVYGRN